MPLIIALRTSARWLYPAIEAVDAFPYADPRFPIQLLGRLADVGDIEPLIAGPPLSPNDGDGMTGHLFEQRAKFLPDGELILCASSYIVDLSGGLINARGGCVVGVQQILYIEQVTDLLAVAVDRDGD
jgi:hypothetical protein